MMIFFNFSYIYIYMVVDMDPCIRFLREVSLFNFGLLRVCITIFFHRFIKNKRKEECKSQRKEGFLILLPNNFFISCLSQNNIFFYFFIKKKFNKIFFLSPNRSFVAVFLTKKNW